MSLITPHWRKLNKAADNINWEMKSRATHTRSLERAKIERAKIKVRTRARTRPTATTRIKVETETRRKWAISVSSYKIL